MGMAAEEGDRPKTQVWGPRTKWGQSEGKIEQRERSHWFVGTQFEEEKGTGKQSGTFPLALSLLLSSP